MNVLSTVSEMREWTRSHNDRPRAAVFTMGALHDGHMELVRFAREDIVAKGGTEPYVLTSIFVNPTQFTNSEDLEKYPRTLDRDLEMLREAGVDAVFVPSVDQMYPEGSHSTVTVDPGVLGDVLEGEGRPGHFRGVLTVVNKLFNITAPQFAYFGEKDFQQLSLIQLMARTLALPIDVVGVPTVRDSDGLALSSRNRRLDENARALSAHIPAALQLVADQVSTGGSVSDALNAAAHYLSLTPDIHVHYLVVTGIDLGDAPIRGTARVLIAADVAGVRLIDNMKIEIKGA